MLLVRAASWTEQNEAMICRALATATLEDIKFQVEHGAQLFEVVSEAGEVLCAFVLRVDRLACRTVGVIVAAGGGAAGVDLTAVIVPHIERHMFVGVDAIAVHTERAGLIKKLSRQGYKVAEIILEKEVGNHGT
jgi:hypothetical protein